MRVTKRARAGRRPDDNAGLFGYIGTEAKIMNLSVKDVNITGEYAGGLVGDSVGIITGCNVRGGSVTDANSGGGVGGLVGYNNGTIKRSFTDVAVYANYGGRAGGLVGVNKKSVDECFARGDVTAAADNVYAGGLVGLNNNSATIQNCYAEGKVTSAPGVTGVHIGGLAGDVFKSTIKNSYSCGAVSDGVTNIGGLIGSRIDGIITGCYFDTEASGQSVGVDNGGATGVTGATTAEMASKDVLNELNGDPNGSLWVGTILNNIRPFLASIPGKIISPAIAEKTWAGSSLLTTGEWTSETTGTVPGNSQKMTGAPGLDGTTAGVHYLTRGTLDGPYQFAIDVVTPITLVIPPSPPSPTPVPTPPTTPINGVDVNYTIDSKGKVTLKPTDEQIRKLLNAIDTDGALNITVSGISGMTAAILEIDLTKLLVSDKLQIFKFSILDMEIRFPVGALESMRKLATTLRFGLAPGSVIFELTDKNGKEINWYDYQNPVTVSMPFTPPQDTSTHQIVMVRKDGMAIPRSWYEGGSVYAKACKPGTYDAAIKPLASFTDTQGKWMAEAVGYIGARGIVEGVGNNLFDVQGTITKAHFVTMLIRALDVELEYEEAMPPEDFGSVPEWAQKAVRMATALGITLRDEDGNFNPNAPILRQDMFFMAYEAMDACGMLPDAVTQQFVLFDDWDDVEAEHVDAIQNLSKLKLVNGNGDGTLNPNGESTRSEGAQFLYNILKYDAK